MNQLSFEACMIEAEEVVGKWLDDCGGRAEAEKILDPEDKLVLRNLALRIAAALQANSMRA